MWPHRKQHRVWGGKKHFFRVKLLRVDSVVVNAVEEVVGIYIEFFADVCDKAHVAAVQISVFLYV